MRSSSAALVVALSSTLFACGVFVSFADYDTAPGELPRYGVSGRIEGLEGANVTLLVNGQAPGLVRGDGDFSIPDAVVDGASFEVTVASAPLDHRCELDGATGTIRGADAAGVVVRCPSTNAALSSLTLSAAALTPSFDPNVHAYVARVKTPFFAPTKVTTTVTATSASRGARITIGGITVLSGMPSAPITLVLGSNHAEITVTPAATTAPGSSYAIAIDGRAYDYLKAATARPDASLGRTMAISGDTLVVGATYETSGATGVDGNQNDSSAIDSGAAYVFRRTAAGWSQEAYLKASNTRANASFGHAVAISGDTIVVGAESETSAATGVGGNQADTSAMDAGAAYVFVRSGNKWSQQAYLKASNARATSRFGSAVGIDGDTIVVGASSESSAAAGVDGDQADTSSPSRGAAYVFGRAGTTWAQKAYLKASDLGYGRFGWSAAVSGDTIAVGASGGGGANKGTVTLFTRSGATWSTQAVVIAEQAQPVTGFGKAVALSADGNALVVGASSDWSKSASEPTDLSVPYSGAAYVFRRTSGTSTWTREAYLKAKVTRESAAFGDSVAIMGDTIVIGASGDASGATGFDGNAADVSSPASGAAHVFRRSGVAWVPATYVKAPRARPSLQLGSSVAIGSDGAVIVGAPGDESAATGIDGDESSSGVRGSGAVFAFH
jgi:hypothetical protein